MKSTATGRMTVRLGLCAVGLCALILISPGVGTESSTCGWRDAWRAKLGWPIDAASLSSNPLADLNGDGVVDQSEVAGYAETAAAIFDLRLPRTLLALQVGMTLALCGATFQILFRNPLATPYTLGIASGGSLGALIALRLGVSVAIGGFTGLSLFAFVGGLVVVGIVVALARGARRLSSNEVLLAGVTVGLFCQAMMMVVTAISNERETFAMVRWMMGSLDPVSSSQGGTLLPFLVPAWLVLVGSARSLNQYRLGDELAATRGVNVPLFLGVCVLFSTVATGAVVARCGPIGFVGLVVPHIVRLLIGSDCRVLLPASALAGGGFLILCDWGSQFALPITGWATGMKLGSATLPIGVVTAVVGVPVFLVLLKIRRKSW